MADLLLNFVQLSEDLLSSFNHAIQRPGALNNGSSLEELLLLVEVILAYCALLGCVITDLPDIDVLISSTFTDILDSVRTIVAKLEAIFEEHQRCRHSFARGRPKLDITEGQMLELLDAQFSLTGIPKLLSCSSKTVRRRIIELGLTQVQWNPVNDAG